MQCSKSKFPHKLKHNCKNILFNLMHLFGLFHPQFIYKTENRKHFICGWAWEETDSWWILRWAGIFYWLHGLGLMVLTRLIPWIKERLKFPMLRKKKTHWLLCTTYKFVIDYPPKTKNTYNRLKQYSHKIVWLIRCYHAEVYSYDFVSFLQQNHNPQHYSITQE